VKVEKSNLILEFPDDVPPALPEGDPRNGEEFDFDLSFDVPALKPVEVKGMFAGKIEASGQTFYIPLWPCVTDFSEIPPVEIPVASAPQFLTPQIVDHIGASGEMTCDGQVYDFSGLEAGEVVYLPLVAQP
jgi:hypothetical protein